MILRRSRTIPSLLSLVLLFTSSPGLYSRQRALTPNMRVHNFHSGVLSQDRHILVWLPPGYGNDPAKRYPVFYMHDGQNKYLNWRIDETAQALIASEEIEPLILVGIYHGGTHEDRFRDYTPTHDPNYRSSGKADAYGRMLIEEIKPFIDSQYRTLSDAANTGLGGASLGGLVSLYLGLKYPGTFGKLALMSPSVWWDDRLIIKNVKKLSSKPNQQIWLDVGTNEGGRAVGGVKQLRNALVAKGWDLNSDLRYLEAKGAEHNEKAFAGRADQVLRYLFAVRATRNSQ
jgi:predicted alpha/beta superfamily hydrolase